MQRKTLISSFLAKIVLVKISSHKRSCLTIKSSASFGNSLDLSTTQLLLRVINLNVFEKEPEIAN